MESASSRHQRQPNDRDFVSDWFSVEDLLSKRLLQKGDLIEMHHYSIRNQWGIFYDDGENRIAYLSGVCPSNRKVYGSDLRKVALEQPYPTKWCRINNGEDTQHENNESGKEIAEKAKNFVGFQPRRALLWTSYHFAKTIRYGSTYYDVAAKAFRLNGTNVGYESRWQTIEELQSELCEGDLVEISRAGGIYSHWGMAQKDKELWKLIHLTGGGSGFIIETFTRSGHGEKALIESVDIRDVVKSSSCRINNSFDVYREVRKISDVIKDALNQLGESEYHIIVENCEKFVKKIRNGDGVSKQGIWVNFALGIIRQLAAMRGGVRLACLVKVITDSADVYVPIIAGKLVVRLIVNVLVLYSPSLLKKFPNFEWIKNPIEAIKELKGLREFKGSEETEKLGDMHITLQDQAIGSGSNNYLAMEDGKPIRGVVYMDSDVMLEAKQELLFSVAAAAKLPDSQLLLYGNIVDSDGEKGYVLFANQVIKVRNGIIPVRVINTTYTPYLIKKNTPIGFIKPIDSMEEEEFITSWPQ